MGRLMRPPTRDTLVVLSLAAVLLAPIASSAGEAVDQPPEARQRQLLRMLRQDCGSCHGLHLTGGLGPALTARALKDKPPESLTATIVSGRPGTAMPPWRRFLSEAEAQWLVARMREGTTDEP